MKRGEGNIRRNSFDRLWLLLLGGHAMARSQLPGTRFPAFARQFSLGTSALWPVMLFRGGCFRAPSAAGAAAVPGCYCRVF